MHCLYVAYKQIIKRGFCGLKQIFYSFMESYETHSKAFFLQLERREKKVPEHSVIKPINMSLFWLQGQIKLVLGLGYVIKGLT